MTPLRKSFSRCLFWSKFRLNRFRPKVISLVEKRFYFKTFWESHLKCNTTQWLPWWGQFLNLDCPSKNTQKISGAALVNRLAFDLSSRKPTCNNFGCCWHRFESRFCPQIRAGNRKSCSLGSSSPKESNIVILLQNLQHAERSHYLSRRLPERDC